MDCSPVGVGLLIGAGCVFVFAFVGLGSDLVVLWRTRRIAERALREQDEFWADFNERLRRIKTPADARGCEGEG